MLAGRTPNTYYAFLRTNCPSKESLLSVPDAYEYPATIAVFDVHGAGTRVHILAHGMSETHNGPLVQMPLRLMRTFREEDVIAYWPCPSSTISRLNCISCDFNSVFPSLLPIYCASVDRDESPESSLREIISSSNPLTAELLAIRSAYRLALTYGWQNAIWASQLALSFSGVKRDCNLAVHLVAKIACRSHENFLWDDSFPDVISSVARSDII
ncbi:hypothetical protein Tco_0879896 [Tanacetum coccineum]